ncbi:MAG TPA: M50 family metallopeptidase [Actinomycetospora sp.]|jgi:hypothetical protein|uniref:M50 family metallopeptidase n=1 Tax=Actinomycetospora sp. TaxID=1872135 RepID=UPI002F3FD595
MDDLIGVSVVGQPLVYGAGFIALLLVVFTGSWAGSIVTVAHEGGHMFFSVLTFWGFRHFDLEDGGGGGTDHGRAIGWGPGDFVLRLAGYLTPPLLGLAGAAVLVAGNAWGILASAAFLFGVAFLFAHNGLANLVTLIAAAGIVLVLWRGSTFLQVTVAIVVIWWLLIGGVRSAVIMATDGGSDAAVMGRRYLLPAVIWKLFWITVALVCLYAGGRLLFTGTAWPAGVWPFDVRA